MYKCYQCGKESVAWKNDYDFADFGLEGEGIVQTYHCSNCNSQITYYVPATNPHKEQEQMEGQINVFDLIGG